ncbi:MAG: hypothetical protein IIB07_08555 [Bacteroidetes bacterium]|nr:hypothetical protein [Bacteroidota bacterium]
MKEHTYSKFAILVYRFGNIPVTFFLSLYLISLGINLDAGWFYIVPFIITLLLIYFLNKHYLILYKILPTKILADDEKIICSNFFLSKREITIYYKNIVELSGSIFSGKISGLMKVIDGERHYTIGFFHKIKGAKELETLILSKVNRDIYNEVINRIGFKKKEKE